MRRFIDSCWFQLADIACVAIAIVLWEIKPQYQAWPLLLALIPWGLRSLAGKFPFHRTRFDIPMLIFGMTAVGGVLIAYNSSEAAQKFWLLVGGILLFYAIAGQSSANLRLVAIASGILGPGMALFFLLENNWVMNPAKVGILNTAGLELMKFRPLLPAVEVSPHPNLASGLIAFTSPFLAYYGLEAWKEGKFPKLVFIGAGAALSSIGLLLATSRGAAIGLAGGMGVWLLAVAAQRRGVQVPPRRKKLWFFLGVILFLAAAGLVFSLIANSGNLETNIDTASSAASRLELSHSATKLLGDFPFTGGGLHTFGGLYSTYIQVLPVFKIINSHNHYLDIALEQGPLGLVAFLLIYGGSFWYLWKREGPGESSWLANVTLAGLVIICIHGFFDDLIYNAWLTPLIFFLPGLVYAIAGPHPGVKEGRSIGEGNFLQRPKADRRLLGVGGAVLLAFFTFVYANGTVWMASWYANMGSIAMAKVDLADFPTEEWQDSQDAAALEPAKNLFMTALAFDPQNRTANHRLGMMAMDRRDFQAAVSYLEAAYQSDPTHRGIWKSLGYAYVWMGKFDRAEPLLEKIPEAQQEMNEYAWWWGAHGRDDLARNAKMMRSRLSAQP